MGLGHLLTRSGLTYPEVSSKFCHDSFCQLGNSVLLPWVIYYGKFYSHVLSRFPCIPVICLKFILCILYKERAEFLITLTGFKIFRMGADLRHLRKMAKERKTTISCYCLSLFSVCPFVCPHGKIVLPLNGFPLNLTFENFSNTCHENSSFFY